MTKQEAIKGLKVLRRDFSGYKPNEEMFDIAIEALEQEPSAQPFTTEQIQTMQELESAQVEKAYELGKADRTTGHWIWMGEQGDSRFMCSACKCKENVPTIMGEPTVWSFCPNCGADMRERSEE